MNHVTLSNFRSLSGAPAPGAYTISEQGNLATLDLTGLAEHMFVERIGTDAFAGEWDILYMDVSAAQGYKVKSVRWHTVLDFVNINAPETQAIVFGSMMQDPALAGVSLGFAYDGVVTEFDVDFALYEIDSSIPFQMGFQVETTIANRVDTPAANSYTSLGFRSITPQIETVPIAQVPEPASWAMLLTGLAGAGAIARRRKH